MADCLDQVTPLLLTYNEEANISRTLACLHWAQRVVVVDSFSTDATPPPHKISPLYLDHSFRQGP